MEKILITGGGGFIGSHLCEVLVKDFKIVVFDSLKRNALKSSSVHNHPHIELIQGDIRSLSDLERAARDVSAVIHCAAIAGIDSVGVNPLDTLEVNLMGTQNLLQAVKGKKLSRFIQFSTSEVYGPYIYKGTENDLTSQGPTKQVRWTYAVSKLAAEHLAFAYHTQHGLPVVSVRPFNIYGPRQVGEGAIQKFIQNAVENKDLMINGDGTQIRSWCFISDFVDGVIRCLRDDRAVGETFNIGNPQAAMSTAELAQKIIGLAESKSVIKYRPGLEADVEVRVPSTEKAKNSLGYAAKVDLTTGIRQTLAWYRSQHS